MQRVIKRRKRFARNNQIWRKGLLSALILIFILMIMLGGVWVWRGSFLTIHSVSCLTHLKQACHPEIELYLEKVKGNNIFTFKVDTFQHLIVETFPYINQVEVMIHFPSSLEIIVEYDKPVMVVQKVNEKPLVFTKTGHLLPFEPTIDWPKILIESEASHLELNDVKKIHDLITLINTLRESNITFESITYNDPNTLMVHLPEPYKVIIAPNGDISRQVATLQAILETATMNRERPLIDVRFDKPVLKPIPMSVNAEPVASISTDIEE